MPPVGTRDMLAGSAAVVVAATALRTTRELGRAERRGVASMGPVVVAMVQRLAAVVAGQPEEGLRRPVLLAAGCTAVGSGRGTA